MLRDIWTNKWILGGLGFLVIFAGLCYVWYQHTTAPYREQAAELDERVRQYEKQRTVSTANRTEQAGDAPADSTTPTAEKSIDETTPVTDKTETTQAQTEAAAQNAGKAEVRVSKFGFGPYPEIPPDFPYPDLFDATTLDNVHDPDDPDYELMYRVRVELWKRGERGVQGMQTSNKTGLFYPAIPGTIYVEWAPRWKIAGLEVGRRIRAMKGSSDDVKRLHAIRHQVGRPLLESDIPSDMKVLEMSEGINPYTFLDLHQPE